MPMGEMGDHHLLATNGVNIGALMRSQAGHAPCWIYSIGGDDIDAAMEQIKAGGGQVIDGPHQMQARGVLRRLEGGGRLSARPCLFIMGSTVLSSCA